MTIPSSPPARALPRVFLGAAPTWEPAAHPPTLYTFAGWGARLVRAPLCPDGVEGEATLYLVVAWTPVWPLCRYRVTRTADGEWLVSRVGPLRAVDWLRPFWRWAALAVVLWVWGALAQGRVGG